MKDRKQNKSRQKTKLGVECLEPRRLMAADAGDLAIGTQGLDSYVEAATTYPALNLAKLQTVSADSLGSSTAASEAVDGIVSNESRWISDSSGPHWLEVELTAPYPVGSAQLYLGYNDELTVGSFELQYHDGAVWQTITSVTNNTATDLNLIFPSPIENATRYRFYTTESTARIKEFVLLPPNGGAGHPLGTDVNLNLASLREPDVSSTNSSNYAIRAVDGRVDDSSRWLAANNEGPHTFEAVLTTSNEVGSLHLYTGVDSGGSTESVLASFEIEYYTGSSWVAVPEGTVSSGTMTGNMVTGNTSPELVVEFGAPVDTSRIRIRFSGPYGRFREVVVLPANITDTGAVGYPIGTSVEYAARETQNFKDYHDSWYRLAARSNGSSLVSSETGSSQATGETTNDERWYQLLYSVSLDAYRIRNKGTGNTLEVADASMEAGAAIVEGNYSAAPHQLWRLESTDSGYFQIVNVWSGMVIETDAGSPAVVTQQPRDPSSNPADNQEWDPVFQDDYFKKGTGGWVGSFGASWGYDWARNDKDGLGIDKFYAPMQHNAGWPNRGTLHKKYHDWNNDAKPAYLLGFNEPDRPDQANMGVGRAIELWPELMAMDVPLVSPAPALGGENWWLDDFMNRVDNRGFRTEYAGAHWYSGPSVSNIFNHINNVQNRSHGRPVWLTEFSVVDWSNGNGDWSEESNYNFILEFLWRAESKNNLEKYAIFIFTGGTPTNPWDMTNPRSNFRFSGGGLTPFGKAYSSWDGEMEIRDQESYVIHNRAARHRLKNDGSTTLTQDTIRNEDESVQWFLEDAGNGRKYITSVRDGKRLSLGFEGRVLNYAPAGTTGSDVEWTIQQDQYGWHNIIHSTTGLYLRLNRQNDSSNAPISMDFEMVPQNVASGYSSTDWWFVKPYNAVAPPNTSGPQVASAVFNSNTDHSIDLTFSAPIDTASLQTNDFVFENLDTGQSFGADGIFLVDVTTTSASIIFRERPIANGTWQMTALQEGIADNTGAGNPEFQMEFSILHGDSDFDGDVDGRDFMAWLRGYGLNSPDGTADQGDANHDLSVNGSDLAVLRQAYGTGISSPIISKTTFNASTDQSFDFVFRTEVDTGSLEVSDFNFTNSTTGQTLTTDQFFLVDVTSTSASILFRDLPLQNGDWVLEVIEGAILDTSGSSSPGYEYGFSVMNGDSDSDGDVDGSDFISWQRGYGTMAPFGTATQGDANHDLAVDGADFQVWQVSFGSGVESYEDVIAPAYDNTDVNGRDFLDWQRSYSTPAVGASPTRTALVALSTSTEASAKSSVQESDLVALLEEENSDLTGAALAWFSKENDSNSRLSAAFDLEFSDKTDVYMEGSGFGLNSFHPGSRASFVLQALALEDLPEESSESYSDLADSLFGRLDESEDDLDS